MLDFARKVLRFFVGAGAESALPPAAPPPPPGEAALGAYFFDARVAAAAAAVAEAQAAAAKRALALALAGVVRNDDGSPWCGARAENRAAPGFVAELFDGFSHHFEAMLVECLAYRAPAAVADAVEGRGPFRRVLDAGCGTGLLGAELRGRRSCEGAVIRGVDLSPKMVALALAKRLVGQWRRRNDTAIAARTAREQLAVATKEARATRASNWQLPTMAPYLNPEMQPRSPGPSRSRPIERQNSWERYGSHPSNPKPKPKPNLKIP